MYRYKSLIVLWNLSYFEVIALMFSILLMSEIAILGLDFSLYSCLYVVIYL